MAVGHVGEKHANGTIIENKADIKVPYELHFNSSFSVENEENNLEWYKYLQDIPAGSDLLEVWAWDKH